MSMHGVGHRRRQVSLTHLLAHVSRDELDGGLHFRHHAFGFFDAIEARLAEPFLLSNGANRVDVLLDSPRNERAVATHAAFSIDKVVGMAESADAPGDLLALPTDALGLSARSLRLLCDLFQTCGGLWGPTRATLCRCLAGVLAPLLPLHKRFLRLSGRLPGCPLLGGQCA